MSFTTRVLTSPTGALEIIRIYMCNMDWVNWVNWVFSWVTYEEHFFLSFVCHQWVYLSLNLDLLCVCSPDLSCKAVEVVYAIQCHPGSYRVVGGWLEAQCDSQEWCSGWWNCGLHQNFGVELMFGLQVCWSQHFHEINSVIHMWGCIKDSG